VFLLQTLRDGQKTRKEKLYTAFLDIRKAFDTVNHKKLLRVLQEKGTPQNYIQALRNMLYDRKVSLGDEIIKMMQGTPQGSPSSPLLFILFIDPLIVRLRECAGVPLTADKSLQSLFFADDIALCAETITDLQRMLEICDAWAAEYGITFNASKSEVMQLCGKRDQPEVYMDGKPLQWVKEFKYLGMVFHAGRQPKIKMPHKTLWGKLKHHQHVLKAQSGLPLDQQLVVLQSIVLSTALYPVALFEMDFTLIDTFINKQLRRLTGLDNHTSGTFLRCELGVLPAELLGHIRCLSLLWRLENQVWFKDKLRDLIGKGPYNRLKNIANQHQLTPALAKTKSKASWYTLTRERVRQAAERRYTALAAKRHMPGPERNMKQRPYVSQGGALARFGVQMRWQLHRQEHTDQWCKGPASGPAEYCTCCKSDHPPVPLYTGQSLLCRRTTHSGLRRFRKRVLCEMEKEHDGKDHVTVVSSMMTRLGDLRWANQSPKITRQVLELIRRATRASEEPRKRRRRAQGMFTQPTQAMINHVEIEWAHPHGSDVVVEAFNTKILRTHLKRLQGDQMLNDELMNFYINLLLGRERARRSRDPSHRGCHFMNTYFMGKLAIFQNKYDYSQVKSWTSPKRLKPGLFEHSKVFVPINIPDIHWTLAVIDMPAQTIKYYDSMGNSGLGHLNHLLDYLKDEWRDKKPNVPPPDWSQWRLIQGSTATPQQDRHHNDCGLFVLYIADLLSQDLPVDFTQEDIRRGLCRHQIAYRILKKSLDQ